MTDEFWREKESKSQRKLFLRQFNISTKENTFLFFLIRSVLLLFTLCVHLFFDVSSIVVVYCKRVRGLCVLCNAFYMSKCVQTNAPHSMWCSGFFFFESPEAQCVCLTQMRMKTNAHRVSLNMMIIDDDSLW